MSFFSVSGVFKKLVEVSEYILSTFALSFFFLIYYVLRFGIPLCFSYFKNSQTKENKVNHYKDQVI